MTIFLKNLKWLNVGQNQITEIPPNFGNLYNLVHLDLSGNALTLNSFPKTFFDLMAIERLYLSDNKIERITAEFGQMKSLRILTLR